MYNLKQILNLRKAMQILKQKHFSGERALFGAKDLRIENSVFGEGESPLKHSANIVAQNCKFEW